MLLISLLISSLIIILLLMLIANRLSYIKTAFINKVEIDRKNFKLEELGFQLIDDAFIKTFDGEDIEITLGGTQRELKFGGVLSTKSYSEDAEIKQPYQFHLTVSLLEGIVIHDLSIGFLSPNSAEFENSKILELNICVGTSTYEYFRRLGASLNKNETKGLPISIYGSTGQHNQQEKFMVTSIKIQKLDINGISINA